jgi:tRNA G18 (ribose-2'-O)-methylase SpoU
VIFVDDPEDPQLAPYRAVRERDLRGAHGPRFIAEGIVVVRLLLQSARFAAESLLLSQAKATSLADFLATLPPALPVYVAAQPVMDAIVGFPVHRGVLAVGRRSDPPAADTLLAAVPDPALVLGLIGLANHDNVGGIFRNAAAFGVDAVLLDDTSCDPLYRKAIRVSVGASLTVPFARDGDGASMVKRLEDRGFRVHALSPSGARKIGEVKHTGKIALLLGAEGPGLPPDILARTQTLRIPMHAGFDSLNVATAAGIALYALRQARVT